MTSTPIFFEFNTNKEAYLALDTMEELGYRVSMHTEKANPILHLIVDRHDLASALEIAGACGGNLIDTEQSLSEQQTYAMAYDSDSVIPIPAHLVNEDWTDSEPALSTSAFSNLSSGAYNDHIKFDPSNDDYDGFDGGVHL